MKIKIEQIPIYHGKIALVVTDKAEDLYEHFTKESIEYGGIHKREYLYAHTLYLATTDDKSCYTILLNFNSPAGTITHGTISHEALHVLDMKFERVDVQYTFEEDEVASYFLEWIVDFIYNTLEEWKLLKKIKTNNNK